jgi:VWFA-related protein
LQFHTPPEFNPVNRFWLFHEFFVIDNNSEVYIRGHTPLSIPIPFRLPAVISIVLAGATVFRALAQVPSPPQTPPTPTEIVPVLHAETRLVVVDVGVTDRSGKPVHGLHAQDFSITENREPQALRHFQELSTNSVVNQSQTPLNLPPGSFTNYATAASNGTLTVFLLDGLNTSIKDQTEAILAMQRFSEHAPSGGLVAIFGLRARLYLLQGFTSDASALRSALHAHGHPGASPLLADAAGSNTDHATTSGIAADAVAPGRTPDTNASLLASTLAQFKSDDQAFQTQLRIQYTLDAFDDLSRYLQNFPGRKNLFWFSAAFPISLNPDPSAQDPFAANQNNEEEYRETLNLLTAAQVAVYPVDARGLITVPLYDAGRSGREFAHDPTAVTTQLNAFYSSQAIEHQTMMSIAESTGGLAFFNTNDLVGAVQQGIQAGSNYYSLAYSPGARGANAQPRHIHITLLSKFDVFGYRLSYRQQYVDAPRSRSVAPFEAPSRSSGAAQYGRLAVSHGAPTPTDILFESSIRLASLYDEAAVAPGNRMEAASHAHGPFHRYAVEFAAPSSQFDLFAANDDRHAGSIEFSAYVYSASGELVNTTGNTIKLNLTPEGFKQFSTDATRFHLEISAPVHEECFLRLAVHDLNSDHFGAIEIPLSSIDVLSTNR